MRILRLADPDSQARSRTPLGDSLINLKNTQVVGIRRPVVHSDETDLRNWHDRWDENQDEIARRLALIETELDRLLGPGPESLQLAVFQEEPARTDA